MTEDIVVLEVMICNQIEESPNNSQNRNGMNIKYSGAKGGPGFFLISAFEEGI